MISRAERHRNAALMVDLSSNNDPRPDLKAHRAAGHQWIAFKATEGNGYVNPGYARLTEAAHRVGFHVVHYHFGTAGVGGVTQAAHFLATIRGHFHRGDAIAYDCEGQPATYRQWRTGEAKTVALAFMAYIDAHTPRVGRLGRRGYFRLVYGPPGFLTSCGVRHIRGWRLWAATYSSIPPKPAVGWRRWTVWQFTDRGTAAGIRNTFDVSQLTWPLITPRPCAPRWLRRKKKGHL